MDLLINGARREIRSNPDRPLLYVLRDELDLTGAKYGCGEGQCGACTVLLDDAPVRSCLTPVRAAQGKRVTTVEALESNGKLHPVQMAFIETGRDAVRVVLHHRNDHEFGRTAEKEPESLGCGD